MGLMPSLNASAPDWRMSYISESSFPSAFVDNKAQVEYIVQKAKQVAINIHPIGAISKKTEGRELSEMYDMRQSGALAFSDGINPIQNSGLLLKTFYILQSF